MPPFQEPIQSPKGDSATPFDPYHRWLGIRPEEQPADHYRLLGLVRFEDDLEAIRDAASRQMAHVRSYALGPHVALSQRILNELAAAKACLLEPAKKAEYDLRLGKDLRVTELRDTVVGAMPSRLAEKDEAAVEEQWPPASQVLLAGSSSPGTRSAWRLIGYGIGGAVGVAAVIAIAFWATRGGPGPATAPTEDSLREQLAQLKLELAQLKQEPEVQAATKAAPPSAPGAPPSVPTPAEPAATDSTKPADKSSGASGRFDAKTTDPVSDSPDVPENVDSSPASKTPKATAPGLALRDTEQVHPKTPSPETPERSSTSQNEEKDKTKFKLLRAVCAERVVILAQWESAKSRLGELNAKLVEQQGKLTRLNASGANVQQQGAYIEGRIRFLVNNQAAYTSDPQTAADYAQTLDTLRVNLAGLQRQYSALDNEARETNTVIGGHQRQIIGVQAEIARLYEKANQLRAQWLELTDIFGTLQRGEHERAIATLTEWTILESSNAHPYLLRGLVYEQAGDKGRAQADFRRASQLAPREAPALLRWYHERMKRTSISPASSRRDKDVARAGAPAKALLNASGSDLPGHRRQKPVSAAGDDMPTSDAEADRPELADPPVYLTVEAKATLDYWNAGAKAKAEYSLAASSAGWQREKAFPVNSKYAARLAANAATRYGRLVLALDTKGVDERLVNELSAEAGLYREIGEAMSRSDTAFAKIKGLRLKELQVHAPAIVKLRADLSRKHGVEFPSYDPALDAAIKGLKGVNDLALDGDAAFDAAIKGLQEVMEKYPNTTPTRQLNQSPESPDSGKDEAEHRR
jgi:hypothetical protein